MEQEKEDKTMAVARILLEYIKILIWPSILVASFYFYGDELINILKNREVDAFGLRIGSQIEDISKNYEEQISQLKEELEGRSDSQDLLDKVQSMESSLEKQLAHVKSTALLDQTSLSRLSKKERVESLERAGFEAILQRDVDAAIESFSKARELWPDFHNVSEIRNLLVQNKEALVDTEDSVSWKSVVNTILTKNSWGMPQDIREKFVEFRSG